MSEPVEEQQGDAPSLNMRLTDIWAVVRMQWHVIAIAAALAAVVAIAYNIVATRVYAATAVIQLSPVAGQEVKVETVVDYDTVNRVNRATFQTTQLEILRSREVREEAIRRYNQGGYDDLTLENKGAEKLASLVKAVPHPLSDLVDVTVTYTDPERAAALANVMAEAFKDQNLKARADTEKEATAWLVKQIDEWNGKVTSAAEALKAYQTEHDLADIQEETTTLAARQSSLNTVHGETSTARVVLQSTVTAHQTLFDRHDYEAVARDMATPVTTMLLQQYAQKLSDFGSAKSRLGPNHPEYKALQTAVDATYDELKSEVERELRSEKAQLHLLELRESNLLTEIELGDQKLLERQGLRTDYDMLVADLERAKQSHAQLNQQLLEKTLASRTERNNIRVVDLARPNPTPVAPEVWSNLALALVAGAIGGLLVALLREYIDDTISSPLDVQSYLRVPYLGMIPKIVGVTDETELALYTWRHPTSSVAEALRSIRTTLELRPPPSGLHRLLVTSAVSSEGKTSTVVRLGVSFAALGKRVVIVDADLRRPRTHKVFEVAREPGLVGVLDHSVTAAEAVRQSSVPNLWLLPAGRSLEHSSEPLASERLLEVLRDLDGLFDLVIIDTPPTALLSDAAILCQQVDGVVMLVREGIVSRQLVRDSLHQLIKVGANVLGVVVNAVDMTRQRNSYRYYYGYRYYYNRYYSDSPDAPQDNAAK